VKNNPWYGFYMDDIVWLSWLGPAPLERIAKDWQKIKRQLQLNIAKE
jgi:hypothetical protein